MTVLGPPGTEGEAGRTLEPVAAPAGDEARGEDYRSSKEHKVSLLF